MMSMLWVVLFVALIGARTTHGLPVRLTPETSYPHDASESEAFNQWGSESGVYAALPALALVLTAVGVLFGCTWCYRHKDCKLFTASATHFHEARRSQPPDSGFSEPVNNNISEDNNNGPISLREMQNIANNNAAAYIVSENEERNRVSRESVVEFEPLPTGIRVTDPLERCADWFGGEDIPRNRLQYLREIGRGWFGRVVEGELEEHGSTATVAVKILNQNATLEDKARFLDESKMYRDARHENILAFIAKCLQEDPWILIFELCSMDLQQYLIVNRPKMAILNESGVPLQLMCDVSSALAYLHSRGYLYGNLWCGNVLVRGSAESARAVLGRYSDAEPGHECAAPEASRNPAQHTTSSEVWSLGVLIWEVCAWGAVPSHHPPPLPDLPCPYRNHLYQVMQLCWNPNPEARPTSTQVYTLINHLYTTHTHASEASQDDGYGSSDFEERWQRLKPNSIPKIDEHVAIIHAPSTSMASHFTGSDQEFDNIQTIQDTLSVDMDTAVSRSSSIMSDKDPLSILIKSESLTNLHGSLEDVRNIYLTHNEAAVLECHQVNIRLEDNPDKDHDHSDSSVDPWLKDIIAGSQDDVSYYKDVSDVIKNLDNILNSEKTSSSESSHQASPSRDNLSLDCKKDYPMQSSMVKSPGINNFQNILEMGFKAKTEDNEPCEEEDVDHDTIGTLSHSFERHSDTTSQHTLENLTPDTPVKDVDICKVESQIEVVYRNDHGKGDMAVANNVEMKSHQAVELPKENKIENSDNKLPTLKELCVASISSVSETKIERSIVREDCQTPCDNKLTEIVRTDIKDVETKSIEDTTIVKANEESSADFISGVEQTEMIEDLKHVENIILPKSQSEHEMSVIDSLQNNEHISTDAIKIAEVILSKSINESSFNIINNASSNDSLHIIKQADELVESKEDEKLENVIASLESADDDDLKPSNLISPEKNIKKSSKESQKEAISHQEARDSTEKILPDTPDTVQNIVEITQKVEQKEAKTEAFVSSQDVAASMLQIEKVQNIPNTPNNLEVKEAVEDVIAKEDETPRSDLNNEVINETALNTDDSTVYMDLVSITNSETLKEAIDDNVKDINSCIDLSNNDSACSFVKNESTVYLDLPNVKKEIDAFLHSEKILSSYNVDFKDDAFTSTPKGSDTSADVIIKDLNKEDDLSSQTKVPNYGPGVTLTRLEQRIVPENLSPFESPTKSHHTDTYDENSSVVLGPFENCTLDLFKGVKSTELVDLPKEELLAFSSNFSEINLETPSPLRDGNFLNEVPDIAHDDLQFDDIETVSENKPEKTEVHTDNTDTDGQFTEKRVSPSTPPNSPGIFLASTSQEKYLVDIDLNPPERPQEPDSGLSSLQKEIDLNQIELQITSKLAMAENENNMNIEYSGPLTVEGVVSEDSAMIHDSDALPEAYLAGNGDAGASVEDLRQSFTIDEECVQALRNELELKLPLAQVASIEPQCEGEPWLGQLPPPPELLVSYPGALSPIAEETGQQLTAYESDAHWNASIRTDSSESYPEPCNNSTDEVTDLPTGAHGNSTYTIHSREHSPNNTNNVHRDITSSKEITMSADSLNASPCKNANDTISPIDDRTYNVNDDEKESGCERISQISPFLLSPTTETSAPDTSDNVTGVSTLSKTTVATDAKISKPSETQCLSKATSIDSWCSNDTLYNVEENFDDLAMDSDIPDYVHENDEDKSETSHTLTHNDDEKEASHCSTYIIHDSKSEERESFSPDSITANDNYTYTKAKIDAVETSPSVLTKSEVNDSTKNTQTKDLAYGTLMSGMPSYSNCTTELISGTEDVWKFAQPELVRQSPNPMGDEINATPPRIIEREESVENESPQLTSEPCVKEMDSVVISCLEDNLKYNELQSSESQALIPIEINDSPQYKHMAHSVTSTPLTEPGLEIETVEPILMQLPQKTDTTDYFMNNIPNLQTFLQSAELRPQDISSNASNERTESNQNTEILLEGDSETLSKNKDSPTISAGYSAFENSVITKPQEVHSSDTSSQRLDNGINSEELQRKSCQNTEILLEGDSETLSKNKDSPTISAGYSVFENSVITKPQEVQSNDRSSQRLDNGMDSEESQHSENLMRNSHVPSSSIDASSQLLQSERWSNELATSSTNVVLDKTDKSNTPGNNSELNQTIDLSQHSVASSNESHNVGSSKDILNAFVTDFNEETDQPHSIIITEALKYVPKEITQVPSKISIEANNSPIYYKDIEHLATSTPFTEVVPDCENEPINIQLTGLTIESPGNVINSLPNFQTFFQSAELKPQDISSNASSQVISANQDSKALTKGCTETTNKDSTEVSERSTSYLDFEHSAISKPQDLQSRDKSSHNEETDGFREFENSIRTRPQDLSSLINASSLLLKSEIRYSELAMGSLQNVPVGQTGLSEIRPNNEPTQSLDLSPPIVTNFNESRVISNIDEPVNNFLIDLDTEEGTEQPHSIIITEVPNNNSKQSPNRTYDSHTEIEDQNNTYNSHESRQENVEMCKQSTTNGFERKENITEVSQDLKSPIAENIQEVTEKNQPTKIITNLCLINNTPNGTLSEKEIEDINLKRNGEQYATVNFLNEPFEELLESNVDDHDSKDIKLNNEQQLKNHEKSPKQSEDTVKKEIASPKDPVEDIPQDVKSEEEAINTNGIGGVEDKKITSVTENFLQNEKQFCQLDSYFPLLSDIRFTGPATEMSTSFSNDSPTEPTAPIDDQNKTDAAADILKDWDSDTDSHSSNSSSGEFIWKQRGSGSQGGGAGDGAEDRPAEGGASSCSGDSGSGSEGDEVEFVPSSWDCRAEPAKSSLRSLEQATPDNKKRVVFKRQKYHCVYEYPREVADLDSPAAYQPDFSTYADWEPSSAEEAELGYGQLFGAPSPLDLYPLRMGIAFGADYDEDFFISSSARPFESLGIMSTTSQFFPGMHVKPALLAREPGDDTSDEFPPPPPPPPPPLPAPALTHTIAPSLDFTTPDSGVEDITPGSTTTEEDFKTKKLLETDVTPWRPADSGSSSESVSPSSPGGEALGGLRHTRDKLKLDLPPSPHIPSPRHNRVFNFVLDKPKRHRPAQDERPPEVGTTPLVMTDDTPIISTSLPLLKGCEDVPVPEPTFSTFGKSQRNVEPEQKGMILTDDVQDTESSDVKEENTKVVEAVKGEGTVLDSGDEDSGIESSSKATLERNKTTPNIS